MIFFFFFWVGCFDRTQRDIFRQAATYDSRLDFKANRSTEDAITTTLHSILSHLEGRNTYARVLFIDFSSAFNAIIPQQLVEKLRSLNMGTSICDWILSFHTQQQQAV